MARIIPTTAHTVYVSTIDDVTCRSSLFICENKGINAPCEMLRKESHKKKRITCLRTVNLVIEIQS